MVVSPPIRFRIEWADSQGKVTASWLAAHFNFEHFLLLCRHFPLSASNSLVNSLSRQKLTHPDNCVTSHFLVNR
jgi:hypothetical protein